MAKKGFRRRRRGCVVDDNDNAVVPSVLKALVQHYQDPIHHHVDHGGLSLPYFSSTDEWPDVIIITEQPVMQHFIERLNNSTSNNNNINDNNNLSRITTLQNIVVGYSTWIRPTLFLQDDDAVQNTGIPVLRQYELLLAFLLLHLPRQELPEQEQKRKQTALQKQQQQQQQHSILLESLDIMTSDVTLLTQLASSSDDASSSQTTNQKSTSIHISNVVLPTLIRIVTHSISVLQKLSSINEINDDDDDDDDSSNNTNHHHHDHHYTAIILQRVTVRMLAFGQAYLDPRQILLPSTTTTTTSSSSSSRNTNIPQWCSWLFQWVPDPTFLYVPSMSTTTTTTQQQQEKEEKLLNKNTTTTTAQSLLNLGEFLVRDNNYFWNAIQLNASVWESNLVTQQAERFWKHLYAYLKIIVVTVDRRHHHHHHHHHHYTNEDKNEKVQASQQSNQRVLIQRCLEWLSVLSSSDNDNDDDDFPKAVRAHFFGRDGVRQHWTTNTAALSSSSHQIVTTNESKPKTRLHLGRVVVVPDDNATNNNSNNNGNDINTTIKAFHETPSRVHAALHYILLLEKKDFVSDNNNVEKGSQILEEILPIIYELLSDHEQAYIALGSASVLRILQLIQTVDNQGYTVPQGQRCVWNKYTQNLVSVLDLACRTCREGAPMVFLARAQSMVCQTAPLWCDDNAQGGHSGTTTNATTMQQQQLQHRRNTTRYFLTILDKHNHRVSDPDHLLWAVLVGGILPLLYQHATVPECIESTDAVELGRLGLTALLPIIRYSSGWKVETEDLTTSKETFDDNNGEAVKVNATRKLLAPSLLALVYLMQAAYPIMPRHGGKIMSEIVGLLQNLEQQGLSNTTDEISVQDLVLNTAGIALVLCQDRAAEVLDLICQNEDGQETTRWKEGTQIVKNIRENAGFWVDCQKGISLASVRRKSVSGMVLLE